MNITRRLFLRNSAAASAVAATVSVPAIAEARAEMSAQERYDFHLAEFKKAAEALDPMIGHWHVSDPVANQERGCSLIVTAFRYTGRYEGDGIYEGGNEKVLGGYCHYQVRLLKTRIDGERSFELRTSMDRMVLSEPRLKAFIHRKVGELA